MARRPLLCVTPEVGAVCGSSDRTDLCGGPRSLVRDESLRYSKPKFDTFPPYLDDYFALSLK